MTNKETLRERWKTLFESKLPCDSITDTVMEFLEQIRNKDKKRLIENIEKRYKTMLDEKGKFCAVIHMHEVLDLIKQDEKEL